MMFETLKKIIQREEIKTALVCILTIALFIVGIVLTNNFAVSIALSVLFFGYSLMRWF